jgi:hypothetical protein
VLASWEENACAGGKQQQQNMLFPQPTTVVRSFATAIMTNHKQGCHPTYVCWRNAPEISQRVTISHALTAVLFTHEERRNLNTDLQNNGAGQPTIKQRIIAISACSQS